MYLGENDLFQPGDGLGAVRGATRARRRLAVSRFGHPSGDIGLGAAKKVKVKKLIGGKVKTVKVTKAERNAIRAARPPKPTTKPRKGYQWKFSVGQNQWVQAKKPKGGGLFGKIGRAIGGAAKGVFKVGKGVVKAGVGIVGGPVLRTAGELVSEAAGQAGGAISQAGQEIAAAGGGGGGGFVGPSPATDDEQAVQEAGVAGGGLSLSNPLVLAGGAVALALILPKLMSGGSRR